MMMTVVCVQALCIAGKLVLHFLQLAAFSFLLMEAIHTYVRIQSSTFGLNRIKYSCLKYFLVGWGQFHVKVFCDIDGTWLE